ncbi:glycoside hydrolase family 5 protein [Ideonella sp.]|uniref:glycoside hydrolase family 5 protein n=1 Tax=Ideonella sp. TaxID=1929293 RepID=UPI0035B23095
MLTRPLTTLALGLSLTMAMPASALAAAAHLSVRGQEIVDPNGQPILLRGWNWGHWGKTQASDAADNAAQGANTVRIPLRWWGQYDGKNIDSRDDNATTTAGIDPAHLKHLDDMVHWASAAKLWIVLFIDSDCGQSGTQNEKERQYCDPRGEYAKGGHNFWTDRAARQKFIAVWRFIANRYKDTPYIGLFEPLPEPNPAGVPDDQIKAFYAEVMGAIREVAPGVPLLIGGRAYKAPAIRQVYDPAWKDVVYTGNLFLHAKQHGADEASLNELRERSKRLLELRAEHQVPVFVQQVGVRSGEDPDRHGVKAVLSNLVANRIGFAYWEYRGAVNPNEYGVMYQRGNEWVPKRDWIDTITPFFKQ